VNLELTQSNKHVKVGYAQDEVSKW